MEKDTTRLLLSGVGFSIAEQKVPWEPHPCGEGSILCLTSALKLFFELKGLEQNTHTYFISTQVQPHP